MDVGVGGVWVAVLIAMVVDFWVPKQLADHKIKYTRNYIPRDGVEPIINLIENGKV